MPKHWKMQAVIRDPETHQIVGRQRERTFPPDIGARMLKESNDWEVIDSDFEVAPDLRHRGRPGVKMTTADAKPVAKVIK